MERIGNFPIKRDKKILRKLIGGIVTVALVGSNYVGFSLAHTQSTKNMLERIESDQGRPTAVASAHRLLSGGPMYRVFFWGMTKEANNYLERVAQDEAVIHRLVPYTRNELDHMQAP